MVALQVSIVVLAALAVIGLVGGWILAGRILRPLVALTGAARVAATGRLDQHVRMPRRVDEFGELADSFDHMLDRLRDAFEIQERFVANASHELRTPLAVTATLVDVARRAPGEQDYPELLERLRVTNAGAIALTEALMRLASANSVAIVAEPLNLATLARKALADSAEEAGRRGLSLRGRRQPAPTTGGQDVARAARRQPRAERHPPQPGRGFARVDTWTDGHSAAGLRVENDGPVYDAELTARLAEPFVRGAGRTKTDGEQRGHGLGLALVDRIVEVHGGSLTIAPREGGGLIVTVTLRAVVAARRPRAGSGTRRALRSTGSRNDL